MRNVVVGGRSSCALASGNFRGFALQFRYELDSVEIKSAMPHGCVTLHRTCSMLSAELNFDFRSDRKIGYRKQAHASIADIHSQRIHMRLLGENLNGGVPPLAR